MYCLKPSSHSLLEQNSPLVQSKCRKKWKGEANPVCCGNGRTRARILLQRCSNQSSDSSSPRVERVSKRSSLKSVVSRQDMLVVVEGIRDMRAVRRAVDLDVYVLGSATRASDDRVLKELRELGRRYEKLVLLLDADVAGRQARNLLDRSLSGCWHAFISAEESTLLERKDYKDEGDVGVEHAGKNAILESLLKIRRSYPERKVFVREDLISYKLIAPLHERGGSVTARRQLVCRYLGLGDCDGKQLLKQLNFYGFTEAELSEAISWAEARIKRDVNRASPLNVKLNDSIDRKS